MHICVYVTENLRFTILITESENFVAGNVLFSIGMFSAVLKASAE